MSESKKGPKTTKKPKKSEPQTKNSDSIHLSMSMPSLSGLTSSERQEVINEIKDNIYNSINNAELLSAIDKWQKEHDLKERIHSRDYMLLKSQITEYLDSYLLLGYNSQGERIIIQHHQTQKDRDAVMEFLKNVFMMQQQQNFLDINDEDDSGDDEL
jgi:hypothetical protein